MAEQQQTTQYPHLFDELTINSTSLRNRLILAPMCQYSVEKRDGVPTDWHKVHLGARAAGGFGMVVAEASAVSPEGRISPGDVGIWNDEHRDAWAPIVSFIKSQGSVPAIQLAHAGAKASTGEALPNIPQGSLDNDNHGWDTVSPSNISPVPRLKESHELTVDEIHELVQKFADAAQRADEAGFEAIQIHAAHGYLIHQFLSGVTNQRTDDYGGSFENRTRFLREIVAAVAKVWPEDKVLGMRISASDYVEGSWSIEDSEELVSQLVATAGARSEYRLDWIDISSGGIGAHYQGPSGPGYQVPLAQRITAVADTVKDTEKPLTVSAVGVITSAQQAQQIVLTNQAHAVSIGREALADPNFPARAAVELRQRDVPVAKQYHRASSLL